MAGFPQEVVCAISHKKDGNMDFRFGAAEEVIAHRSSFLQKYGILYEDHIAMRCDHTDRITLVTSFNPEVGATSQEEQIHSEALVTQEKGLVLMLFTADCQSTSFYDPITQTIALAHISRKTLCDGLSAKVVAFLQENLCVDPQNLIVTIGPSIQKDSYAFPLPLAQTHKALEGFIEEKDGMAHIDLIGAHVSQLTSLGILSANISVSKEDTTSNDYFSYYKAMKEGYEDPGRMATILMLK